jgi:hypothetical protein
MNWQHLTAQVESMMLDSAVSLEEFKSIIAEEKWYEHPAWSGEKWWFGRGKELTELTFQQIRAMWDWMGLDTDVITGAMRYKIAESVAELMKDEDEHLIDITDMEEVAA